MPWISDNSWKLILDRKDTKQKLLGCQDEKKEDLQQEYRNICKEVKSSIKDDGQEEVP